MKLATVSLSYEEGLGGSEPFDDGQGTLDDVQYVTGMKLYSRRWDTREIIGGMN